MGNSDSYRLFFLPTRLLARFGCRPPSSYSLSRSASVPAWLASIWGGGDPVFVAAQQELMPEQQLHQHPGIDDRGSLRQTCERAANGNWLDCFPSPLFSPPEETNALVYLPVKQNIKLGQVPVRSMHVVVMNSHY